MSFVYTNCFLSTTPYNIMSDIHLIDRKSEVQDIPGDLELQKVLKACDPVQNLGSFALKFFDLLIISLDCMKSVS